MCAGRGEAGSSLSLCLPPHLRTPAHFCPLSWLSISYIHCKRLRRETEWPQNHPHDFITTHFLSSLKPYFLFLSSSKSSYLSPSGTSHGSQTWPSIPALSQEPKSCPLRCLQRSFYLPVLRATPAPSREEGDLE